MNTNLSQWPKKLHRVLVLNWLLVRIEADESFAVSRDFHQEEVNKHSTAVQIQNLQADMQKMQKLQDDMKIQFQIQRTPE